MKGIGEEQNPGWTLQTFEVYMPKGMKAILDAIRDILNKGKIQTLTLEVGRPITYSQFVEAGPETPKDLPAVMTLGEVARNVQMEEYSFGGRETNLQAWFKMFLAISLRGLYVTHIGIGPETRLFKWLGLDEMTYGGLTQLCGAEISRDKLLGSEIMVLFAGPIQGGRPEAITYALKHFLFTPEDLKQEEIDGPGPEGQTAEGGNHTGRPRQADGAVAASSTGQQPANRVIRPRKGRTPQG